MYIHALEHLEPGTSQQEKSRFVPWKRVVLSVFEAVFKAPALGPQLKNSYVTLLMAFSIA